MTLLTDKDRAYQMGTKGREFVIKQFSDHAMTEKMLQMTTHDH